MYFLFRFMETSAKASYNVEESFYILSRDIKSHIDKKMEQNPAGGSSSRAGANSTPGVNSTHVISKNTFNFSKPNSWFSSKCII
jgi:hypothetical protein